MEYRTLLEICGLPKPATHDLEGFDITPILNRSTTDRGHPVVMTYGRNIHAADPSFVASFVVSKSA